MTNTAAVHAVLERTFVEHGRIDVLISNQNR
jgi:NAD(P)-dependent dehydrogenase (short-subunit alcohol dehydrogenase family)